jgi:hypothetical protein
LTSLGPFIRFICLLLVVVPFGLVAGLPFSRRFVVGRVPTPRAVARGVGWGCFRGPVSGRRPGVVSFKTCKK